MTAGLDAKVAALEDRVDMLTRTVGLLAKHAQQNMRADLPNVPDLSNLTPEKRAAVDATMAEAVRMIPRADAMEQVKESASNVLMMVPRNLVAEVMQNRTPAQAIADMVSIAAPAMHPTNKLMADFSLAIARHFAFSWDDLGITAPVEVAK